MSLISDIKLIRTDTTLDLSQKAEKGMRILTKIGSVDTIEFTWAPDEVMGPSPQIPWMQSAKDLCTVT